MYNKVSWWFYPGIYLALYFNLWTGGMCSFWSKKCMQFCHTPRMVSVTNQWYIFPIKKYFIGHWGWPLVNLWSLSIYVLIFQVQEHNHPHVLLLKIGDTYSKLPGGRLRPGENGRILLLLILNMIWSEKSCLLS